MSLLRFARRVPSKRMLWLAHVALKAKKKEARNEGSTGGIEIQLGRPTSANTKARSLCNTHRPDGTLKGRAYQREGKNFTGISQALSRFGGCFRAGSSWCGPRYVELGANLIWMGHLPCGIGLQRVIKTRAELCDG